MTTNSTSTPVEHSSDATFRTWYGEIRTMLAAVGMVQTSDTGQVNPATMTRPGTSAYAGYEVWRFADALQSTAPIYVRIRPGTGTGAAIPALEMQIGTGTNGAGTLTGVTSTAAVVFANANIASTVTNYPTYMCHTAGFFGHAFKVGAATVGSRGFGFWAICRSADNTGTVNGNGATVYYTGSSGVTAQYLSFLTLTASSTNFESFEPMCGLTNTQIGGVSQVFHALNAIPGERVRVTPQLCTYMAAEVTLGSTFTQTLIGTTQHTYIPIGDAGRNVSGQTARSISMYYE